MESSLIDLWMEEPVKQRGKSIVTYMSRTVLPLGLDIRKRYEREERDAIRAGIDILDLRKIPIYDNSKVAYSYAELVHSIFHMTRNEKVYSKKFVACILYSYTLKLTEIYKLYIWNKRKLSKTQFFSAFRDRKRGSEDIEENTLEIIRKINNCHQVLSSVIGETIVGKWVEYFFPEIKIKSNRKYSEIENPEGGTIISYITNPNEDLIITFESSAQQETIMLKLKKIVFITMMYVDINQFKVEDVNWNIDHGKCIFRLKCNNPSDFEFTAFFKHMFLYVDYLNTLEKWILKSLEENGIAINILKYKIQKAFDELWNEYYEWDHIYGNACIPFYSLDITYNMIKKHYMKYEQRVSQYLELSIGDKNTPFLMEYKKMLDSFKDYLNSIDETYGLKEDKAFAKIFKHCPFYGMVKELQNDQESRIEISNYICDKARTIISNMSVKKQPEG